MREHGRGRPVNVATSGTTDSVHAERIAAPPLTQGQRQSGLSSPRQTDRSRAGA